MALPAARWAISALDSATFAFFVAARSAFSARRTLASARA